MPMTSILRCILTAYVVFLIDSYEVSKIFSVAFLLDFVHNEDKATWIHSDYK